jgi:hypothetical protein
MTASHQIRTALKAGLIAALLDISGAIIVFAFILIIYTCKSFTISCSRCIWESGLRWWLANGCCRTWFSYFHRFIICFLLCADLPGI